MENKTLDFQNMSFFSLSNVQLAKTLDNHMDKILINNVDDERLSEVIPLCKNKEEVLDSLGGRIRSIINMMDIYDIRNIVIKNKKYYTYLDENNKNLLYSSLKYGNEYIGYYSSNRNIFYEDELSYDVIAKIKNSSNIIFVKNKDEEYLGICYINKLLNYNDKIGNHIKHNYPKIDSKLHTSDFIRYNHKYYMPVYPIVDDGKLVGVLSSRGLNDLLEYELDDDYFKLAGITQNKLNTDNEQLGRKLPWLFSALFSNFAFSMMFSTFIDKIRQVPILALYLAFVLMISNAVGFMSLGSSLCLLRKNNDGVFSHIKAIYNEFKKSIIIGIVLSIISFVLIYFYLSIAKIDYFDTTYYNSDSIKFALDITAILLVSILVSSLMSFIVPMIINRFDYDYSIGSHILITSLINLVVTALFYLLCYAVI